MAHVATWPLPTSRPNDDRYAADVSRSAERRHSSSGRTGKRWAAVAAAVTLIAIGGAGAFYVLQQGAPRLKEPPPPPPLGPAASSGPKSDSSLTAALPPPAGPTLTPSGPSPSAMTQPTPASPPPAATTAPSPTPLCAASPWHDGAPACSGGSASRAARSVCTQSHSRPHRHRPPHRRARVQQRWRHCSPSAAPNRSRATSTAMTVEIVFLSRPAV